MHNIALIPGDGTGPEVTAEALKVLEAAASVGGFTYDTTTLDFGGERYLRTGETLPEGAIDDLRQFDAIYLGAIGHPEVLPGILEKGILLRIRFELDQYINLRPVKLYPNVETPLRDKGPEDIDFIIVRENTEGLYSGMGGVQYAGTPHEVSTQIHCTTYHRRVPLRPLRLRARPGPRARKPAASRCQDQCADLRPRHVVAGLQRDRRRRLPGHHARLRAR